MWRQLGAVTYNGEIAGASHIPVMWRQVWHVINLWWGESWGLSRTCEAETAGLSHTCDEESAGGVYSPVMGREMGNVNHL